MKIDFYEGFISEKALSKLKLINFPTRIFIATQSLKEFKKFEKIALKYNSQVECAFWPIFKNSYWASPLSNTQDLINVFNEIENCDNHVLIDLEFPLFNIKMMIKNWIYFSRNKKLIKNFIDKHNERLTLAQYPIKGKIGEFLMKFFGLDFNIDVEKSPMWYTSKLKKFLAEKMGADLAKIKNKKNYAVGLGVIAKPPIEGFKRELARITSKKNKSIGIGELGKAVITKTILSPKNLAEDLKFIQESGFDKSIIFRLGGLNKEYIEVIERFVD